MKSVKEIIDSYDPNAPLDQASTIPASWYIDERVYELERQNVFARSWQFVARMDQLLQPGSYVTSEIAGEPIVVVRGADNVLRGFFNVCRHHAAAVMTEPEGNSKSPSLSLSRLDLFARRRTERNTRLHGRLRFRSSGEWVVVD